VVTRCAGVWTCVLLAGCSATERAPQAPRPLRPDTLESNGWDREADLLHLDLDLAVDVAGGRVQGRAMNRLRALRPGIDSIRLHAVGLDISAVEDEHGRKLGFRLESPFVYIELHEPLVLDEVTELSIDYRCEPQKGLYFERSKLEGDEEGAPQVWSLGQNENNRHWIPTWDYPNDRCTFEGSFRVAEGIQALSNGRLVSVDEHDGGDKTFHWKLDQSQVTYLIALAAGPWERYDDEWNGIPLEYYVPPGTGEEKARRALGETPAMMKFFSELLEHPYPYSRYGQVIVENFEWGGMENTTLTILNDYLIGTEGEVGDLDGDPRLLVAHELAHHWFGDLVTCFGWSHLWLNEAWASFLELQFERSVTGDESMRLWLERYKDWYFESEVNPNAPLAVDWPSQGCGPDRAHHVYTKGPWVLYMIENAIGKEAFWRATRAYLHRFAGDLVVTEDFTRTVFDATGHNIEGMIEQWVEGGGYPIYSVSYDEEIARLGSGSLPMRVRQTQKTGEVVPLFDVLIDVDLHYANGDLRRHVIRVNDADKTFQLPLEGSLVDLVFDADCRVLCKIELDKPVEWWTRQALRPNSATQWRALDALAPRAANSATAGLALMALLRESKEPLLRGRAAQISRFKAAIPELIRCATLDESSHVRAGAVSALLHLDLPESDQSRLRSHLVSENSPMVTSLIKAVLGIDTESDPAE
jgi:aminopeptidase N